MFESTRAELATLTAALAARAPDPAGTLALVAELEGLAQSVAAAQQRALVAFEDAQRDADRSDPVAVQAGRCGATVPFEVAQVLHVGTGTSQRRLATARTLVGDFPELLALVGGGDGAGPLSVFGVKVVAEACAGLEVGQRRILDVDLADEVRSSRRAYTVGLLRTAATRRALALDPQAATERARDARASRRGVRLTDPVDGVASLVMTCRAEEALAIWTRLDQTARRTRQDGDPRSLHDLMADLVVDAVVGGAVPVCEPAEAPVWRRDEHGDPPWTASEPPAPDHEGARDADPAPDDPVWDVVDWQRTPSPPTSRPPLRAGPVATRIELQVVLTAQMLLGLDPATPALVRGYGSLPMGAVRDLVADHEAAGGRSVLRALFCDPVDGRLLAMDKQTRRFTGLLGDLVDWRDQHCRLSGARLRHRDHVLDHDRGGRTAAANAQALAVRAHTIKDHPGVTARQQPVETRGDGLDACRAASPDTAWTLPTGQRVVTAPPPALGPGSVTADPFEEAFLHALRVG